MKVVFLDRDGVVNKEKNYLYRIEEFEFIDGLFDACRSFQSLGYAIIIVTNQSGIGRGYYTESDFHLLSEWMVGEFGKNGVTILDIYHCPHTPEALCECRKPLPGMILEAAEIYDIDLPGSWLIGDKESDIEAAISAGIEHTVLVGSGHKINAEKSKATFILDSIQEVPYRIQAQRRQ